MSLDYRQFKSGPQQGSTQEPTHDWWSEKGQDLANAVTSVLTALDKAQAVRIQQLVQAARLYGSLPTLSIPGLAWSRSSAPPATQGRERLSYNVVQSAIDTLAAKIAKNKPKPLFLTSGGDYKQQRKAKKLNRFVEGVFYECKAYDLGVWRFRAGCIDGDGLIHVFEKNGRVAMEAVPSAELWVDEFEAMSGKPRQLHRLMNVDRKLLQAAVKGHKQEIEDADDAPRPPSATPTVSNMVMARESWHLPSAPGAGDGKHAITIAGETLLSEKWEHDRFPFARFSLCPRPYGYWAQGLAEQLMPIQIEINKLLYCIQEAYRLACMAVVFLENGSKVVKSHLTNQIGTAVSYTGTPPQYATPGVLPAEVYAHLESLKRSAYEQAGISQLSAAAQKPAGLNSGKALREYNDIESDRFMTIGHAYENFYLDLARLSISVARDIAMRDGDYSVKWPGRGVTREIDWKDIDLDEDSYIMQCFPVSSLPNEPAGRFQTIQEWVQAGWYTPRQGKKLMNFPDLESLDSLAQAAEEWLEQILDKIVDDGEYTPPDQFDDLELAHEMALEYYQQGKAQGLDEERLEMLRMFMAQVSLFSEQAQSEAAAQMAAQQPANDAGGTPQAQPMAPPQSDMLPQGVAA